MKYLLDTDWMVEFLAGREPARRLVVPLYDAGLAISIITYAEFYEGVVGSPHRGRFEETLDEFVAGTSVLPLDVPAAELFAEIRDHLRAVGKLIDNFDLLIAATALRNDLTLVTRNRRDFERIEGLRVYDAV